MYWLLFNQHYQHRTNQKLRSWANAVFQNRGVCRQAFPSLPSPFPSFLFFFFLLSSQLSRRTRAETLPMQAIEQKKQKLRLRANRPSNKWPHINMFFFLLQTYYLFLRWGAIGLKDCSIKRESWKRRFGLCKQKCEKRTKTFGYQVVSVQICSWR